MSDLFLVLSFVGLLALGTLAPFVFSLGYVWVDTFLPHRISDALLTNVPVAMIMAVAALGSYLAMDRRAPPRMSWLHLMYFLLAAWITLTSTWAVAPGPAWYKWDPSFKGLMFAAFIPFVFRSRVQIEAFLQVMIFSAAAHILPWGIKTALSGGGYKQNLGQLGINVSFLSESSAIAALCFTFIPLLLHFAKYNLIIPVNSGSPFSKLCRLGLYGVAAIYALGSIGTFARVAIVGLAVMFVGMWWRAKKKLWFTVSAAVGVVALGAFTSSQWTERISTVAQYDTEDSSLTRILIWRWAWGFAQDNPLGGGFNAFFVNQIVIPTADPLNPRVEFGRAFHNIYFAVLAEHGYPGAFLYGSILILTFLSLQRTRTRTRGLAEHEWCYELAGATQIGLAVFLACANFIDVSFNPILWDLLALGLCLQGYARRAVPAKARRRAFDIDTQPGLTPVPGRAMARVR